MKVFLAGATGVIGRRLAPLLRWHCHRVTAVASSAAKAGVLRSAGAHPIELDLFDREAVRRAVAGHEVVFNLATRIPPSSLQVLLPWSWRENDRLRRDASSNLADAALEAGAARFVQESFAPAYPDCGAAWIEEHTPLAPARYNRTILDAERSARRFAEGGGDAIVLRFAAFYGPDAFQTRDMLRFVRRGWAPLPGASDAYVSSVSHDDAASAALAALELPAGTYNVSDDEPLRRSDYFACLARALGVAAPRHFPAWTERLLGSTGELLARSQRISNRSLRSASAWTPACPSMREGWPAVVRALQPPLAA